MLADVLPPGHCFPHSLAVSEGIPHSWPLEWILMAGIKKIFFFLNIVSKKPLRLLAETPGTKAGEAVDRDAKGKCPYPMPLS